MKSNHTPEIRFAGFTVDWEERKFENVLNKQDGIRRGPFGSALKKDIFVKNSDYAVYEQQNAIYDNYKTRYNITKEKFDELKNFQLSEGDFILSGAGTIGRISRVPRGIKQGVFNQALIRFKIDDNITDSEYFIQWIRAENMQRKLTGANPGSAITNLVPMSEVKKWNVMVPSKNEQTKIGNFLKQLDETIALHQQELTILKQTKQGFLQKMLPKEGEFVPEIRFPEFIGNWEERNFEDVLNKKDGIRRGPFGSALKKEFFVKDSDYVVYEQKNAIYDNYETRYNITKEKYKELEKFQLNEGDFILSGAGTIGRISRVPKGIKLGVFNQALIRFKIDENITDSEYFVQWIRSQYMQRNLTGMNPGSAITNLVPMSEVKNWIVMVPSKNEQIKIGKFFKQLDETIALYQRELDALQETKKAFLQKMFV
ncbi:restriction endonuclease subunit S [Peribacillus simplex]|uniref:restriction endonuclease subunit S n=1 Tax=Peribacillus simplex TaxID=1478 RepID=UPI00366E6F2A